MKKIIKIFSLLIVCIFTFTLVGCSQDNVNIVPLEQAIGNLETRLDDYQTKIDELENEIAGYKSKIDLLQANNTDLSDDRDILLEQVDSLYDQISSLNKEIEDLESDVSSKTSIIYNLRSKVEEAEKLIKEYENYIKELEEKINAVRPEIKVNLADEYTLVVGDNFQLFYHSVVQAPDPYGYYIKLEGKKGHMYNRYFEYKPTEDEVGTYSLKLSVCDANGVEYGSDETKLVVVPATVENGKQKNILCFGDSLTWNGTWVAQGISRYINAGYKNVKTLGTMTTTLNGVKVNYEGHSGWQWSTYITEGTSPFKPTNSSDPISFKDFCSRNGYSGIDELYILLTWNGIGGRFREFSFEDDLFSNAKTIIDIFHKEYPNATVTLIGIPKPSFNAGLGAYYEIGISYADNYAQSVTAMNYNQFMEDWTKMEEYKDFLFYADGMGQFDTEYNMPTESKPVNNQNPTTEPVGNAMGMHPNNYGYMQLGDVFFRALMRNKTK